MTNLSIGITPRTAASRAHLYAGPIQTATLIQLGRMLAEGDDGARRLIDALEHLGTVSADPREGELDAALDDVKALGHLDDAVMDLSDADAYQLADEAVHAGAIAAGSVTRLPRQQNRRAS